MGTDFEIGRILHLSAWPAPADSPGDQVLDRLTALHLAAAVIEHAALGEFRDVEARTVEVEREEARLTDGRPDRCS